MPASPGARLSRCCPEPECSIHLRAMQEKVIRPLPKSCCRKLRAMSARTVPGANVIRRQTSEEAQGGRAVAESAASADVPWRSTKGSRFVAEQREPGAGVLTPNGRSADTRYDNHQEAFPQLWLSILQFFPALALGVQPNRIPCFRPPSFRPRAQLRRSPSGSYRSSSCRSSAAKVQKRWKDKRRKLWLREHS